MNDEARLVLLWKLVRTASKDRRLSRVDLACLMGVLDRFNPANVDEQGRMVAWPGLKSIATGAHADRSSAVRSMARLVQAGYLERETRQLRQTNVYRIGPAGSGAGAPSGVAAPSRTRATTGRRTDATTVGAATPPQVGAALHPEPALKNLPKEPAQSNLPNLTGSGSRFAEFYSAYPRKVDPKDAERAWLRGKLDALADQIIADVRARIADPGQWAERKFIPHPATYLNKQRWLEEWAPSTKTRGALLPRDSRTDNELEQANREQLARFGMEDAA